MTTVADRVVDERVVLLDGEGHDIGTALKAEVHTASTPLHLAFSCYLFDEGGDLLLTRRALHKRTFPGVWTNSVCGHPLPGEPLEQSIRRRGRDELGVEIDDLRLVLPRFRYRAEMDGLQEHEWCPVAVGTLAAGTHPRLDPDEVAEARTTPWTDLVARAATDTLLSPWCREQIPQLAALGGSWTDWPAADPADLPPAARWS